MLYFRGEILTMQSGDVCASAWLDNKVFTVMCTGFSPLVETVVLRNIKDGTQASYPCPAAVAAYNKHMSGVDRGDQL